MLGLKIHSGTQLLYMHIHRVNRVNLRKHLHNCDSAINIATESLSLRLFIVVCQCPMQCMALDRYTITSWAVRLSWLENAYSRPSLFRRALLTCKVVQTELLFGLRWGFAGHSVQARLQVSVCSGYLTDKRTHPHTRTAFWPAYMKSSTTWVYLCVRASVLTFLFIHDSDHSSCPIFFKFGM